MFEFSLQPALVIQLLLAVLLPIAVGLITTRVTAAAKKAWLLAGLSLLTTMITGIGDAVARNVPFDLGVGLFVALPSFCVSVAMYYGLWKPTGLSVAAQDVKETTLVR